MITINEKEFAYSPGLSLKELVGRYNTEQQKTLAFDGFVVLVNGKALTTLEAEKKILLDNDRILITPLLSGG